MFSLSTLSAYHTPSVYLSSYNYHITEWAQELLDETDEVSEIGLRVSSVLQEPNNFDVTVNGVTTRLGNLCTQVNTGTA